MARRVPHARHHAVPLPLRRHSGRARRSSHVHPCTVQALREERSPPILGSSRGHVQWRMARCPKYRWETGISTLAAVHTAIEILRTDSALLLDRGEARADGLCEVMLTMAEGLWANRPSHWVPPLTAARWQGLSRNRAASPGRRHPPPRGGGWLAIHDDAPAPCATRRSTFRRCCMRTCPGRDPGTS